MHMDSRVKPARRSKRHQWLKIFIVLLLVLLVGGWFWCLQANAPTTKGKRVDVVQIVSAVAVRRDVPVKLTANGTVAALQTVEVHSQISATIKTVHIQEGQFVHKGERLFSLDTRTEAANLSKAEALLVKDRADLTNAERNLERQRELFRQKFISQALLDTAQNQVDGLRGQYAVDRAAAEAARVALSFGEISAPITGRTGAIAVFPGSLVQPGGGALLSITQIDPIKVNFTLPERDLAVLQQALARGIVNVSVAADTVPPTTLNGRLVFVDNAVDSATGSIRLKAEFPNADKHLWPGMFVTVALAPQTLAAAVTVPVQAVQSGPERKFIYVIGLDAKALSVPVQVRLIQDGMAVVTGIDAGMRVVVEGAQNLRVGSVVAEAKTGKSEGHRKAGKAAVQPSSAEEK